MSDPSTPAQPSAFRQFDGTEAETAVVGDVVYFWAGAATAPQAAIVTRVYGDQPGDPTDSAQRGLVDVVVFDRQADPSVPAERVPHMATVPQPTAQQLANPEYQRPAGWEHRPH